MTIFSDTRSRLREFFSDSWRRGLVVAAKFVLYPLFYLFALTASIYLTFPWERLKDRVEAEFAKTQASKGPDAWRLEIDSMSGYWLTGVEIVGGKVTIPAGEDDDGPSTKKGALKSTRGSLAAVAAKRAVTPPGPLNGDDDLASPTGKPRADGAKPDRVDDKKADDEKAKKKPVDSAILIEKAHARVRLLPLLIGRVRIDFGAELFGGAVKGTIPIGGGDLEIDVEDVELGQIAPLVEVVSVPITGKANGRLELTAANGKWGKSSGSFSLNVADMVIGDGKAKFRHMKPLPPAALGTFEIEAKADGGVLRVEKFGATGRDFEVHGAGTITVKEPWDRSGIELFLRFGFSDDYKNKNEDTRVLFLDDGPFPAMVNLDAKLKRARRADGLWGFKIGGRLGRFKYDPTKEDGPAGAMGADKAKTGTGAQTETPAKRKPSRGPKKPADDDDDAAPRAAAPTPRPRDLPPPPEADPIAPPFEAVPEQQPTRAPDAPPESPPQEPPSQPSEHEPAPQPEPGGELAPPQPDEVVAPR